MGWPEIFVICWLTLGAGIALAKHGQPREGNWNFFALLPIYAMWIFVLYMGGFFS